MPLPDSADGLNPPVNKLEAVPTLIFLLFDSRTSLLLSDVVDPEDENIEAAFINARLSFLFLSNLDENFTFAAVAVSSSVAGSSRMPRPFFLEAVSSSAIRFFWLCKWTVESKFDKQKNIKKEEITWDNSETYSKLRA